jgi:hypothetical protein
MELEAKLLLSTFATHCHGLEIRYLYGPPPVPSAYLPRTLDEWKIHLFNLHRTGLGSSVTKAEMAQWILANSSQLNLTELVSYFTESSDGSEILSLVAEAVIERNKENFIECLRDYLLTTGAMTLIHTPPPQPLSDHEDRLDPASSSSRLDTILEIFCSRLLVSTQASQDHLQILFELCQCVLTLNHAILTGQEAYSLPMFFETIRKITSRKLSLFSARELSSLYNTLRTNGPYETPAPPHLSSPSSYLLTAPIFVTTGAVLFHRHHASSTPTAMTLSSLLHASSGPSHEPTFQTRRIYLTSRALYLDPPVLSASAPLLTAHLECIPFEAIRFTRSERDPLVCELHPIESEESTGGGLAVIEYQFHRTVEEAPPALRLCVSFCRNIFFKFRTASEEHFRQLEDCVWRLRRGEGA